MHISPTFPRSRRALLAAGGAAFVGCASLGLLSLRVVSAAPDSPTTALTITAPGAPGDLQFDAGGLVDVRFEGADLKQQQDKFVSTLAGKLGVSVDKLQQALKDTQQEVGPVPLLLGPPGVAGTQSFTISTTSEVSTAAKVLGISEAQLGQELIGKSLSDVARAHNIDPRTVASAIKAAREAELDQAVQANKIPADIANRIKASLDKEIEMQMSIVRAANGMLTGPEVRSLRIIQKNPGQ